VHVDGKEEGQISSQFLSFQFSSVSQPASFLPIRRVDRDWTFLPTYTLLRATFVEHFQQMATWSSSVSERNYHFQNLRNLFKTSGPILVNCNQKYVGCQCVFGVAFTSYRNGYIQD